MMIGEKRWDFRWARRWTRVGVVGLCVGILLIWALESTGATRAKHYVDLEYPPLAEVQIPEYETYRLANGITVYLMEDHELPLVSGTALFKTGSRFEPADKVGLAELTGALVRQGGTAQLSADDLSQTLEQRGAVIETQIGTSSGSAGFQSLTPDLDQVFALYTDVIRTPAFDPQQFEILKGRFAGSIARRNDDPQSIAGREFNQLLYGAESPYARTAEYASLAAISRDDVIAFHRASFRPDTMILGILGDFEPRQMRRRIEEAFGDWQSPQTDPFQVTEALQTVEPAHQGEVFSVDQPQLTQSTVYIGHLGGQLNSPDYPALDVMNEVLNGFGGRLFNEVRSEQGLAYTVFAVWGASYDYPGRFIAGGQTQAETTVPFIQSIRAEMERIRTEPITPDDLARAKDSVLNSFVFNFQDPSQTLSRLLRYDYFDYPLDFNFRYQEGVKSTTIADVERVANTYLKPEDLITLVVGHQAEIQPPLTELDPEITELDITIPDVS